MGRDYEHTIANALERGTSAHVKAYRCGYSGNSAIAQPDVLVTAPNQLSALELKGPIEVERLYIGSGDLGQLVECINFQTVAYLIVKFQRREPLCIRYFSDVNDETYEEMSIPERFVACTPECFEPRTTQSDSLVLDKPDTDEWPSARAGRSDVVTILDALGLQHEHQ